MEEQVEKKKEDEFVEVSGQKVSMQEFQQMSSNHNIRLKKLEEGKYVKLEKMEG